MGGVVDMLSMGTCRRQLPIGRSFGATWRCGACRTLPSEPFALTSSISCWPSRAIRCIAIAAACMTSCLSHGSILRRLADLCTHIRLTHRSTVPQVRRAQAVEQPKLEAVARARLQAAAARGCVLHMQWWHGCLRSCCPSIEVFRYLTLLVC